MVNHIYPSELQLNKVKARPHFWVYIYLYRMVLLRLIFFMNRMTLIFDIVKFPFLDGDVPRSTSYGVYISHFIRFALVSSHVNEFNTR